MEAFTELFHDVIEWCRKAFSAIGGLFANSSVPAPAASPSGTPTANDRMLALANGLAPQLGAALNQYLPSGPPPNTQPYPSAPTRTCNALVRRNCIER